MICRNATPWQFRSHNSMATLLLGGLWCSYDLWEVAELPMVLDADARDAVGTGPHLLQCPVAAVVPVIGNLSAWLSGEGHGGVAQCQNMGMSRRR